MIDETFAERITEDLRAFGESLLEAGLAPRAATSQVTGGSLGALVRVVDRFTTLLPRLLAEASRDNRLSRTFAHRSAPRITPRSTIESYRPLG